MTEQLHSDNPGKRLVEAIMSGERESEFKDVMTAFTVRHFYNILGEKYAEAALLEWVKVCSLEEEGEELEQIARKTPERIHRMAAGILTKDQASLDALPKFLNIYKETVSLTEQQQKSQE